MCVVVVSHSSVFLTVFVLVEVGWGLVFISTVLFLSHSFWMFFDCFPSTKSVVDCGFAAVSGS